MFKRIAAIAFIFICTAIAWAILGSTIFYRTYSSDSQLKGRVVSSWGAPQEQAPPRAAYHEEKKYIPLPLEKSRVNAALHLGYRR